MENDILCISLISEPMQKTFILIYTLLMIGAWIQYLAPNLVPFNYGRFLNSQSKLNISSKVAWVLFEAPNLVLPIFYLIFENASLQNENLIAFFLFFGHYIHRTLIFPIFQPVSSKSFSFLIVLNAFSFTSINSYLQILYLTNCNNEKNHILVFIGIFLFCIGMSINIHSDYSIFFEKERRLKMNDKNYFIPKSGFHKYVVAANYFGELVEWIGYSLISMNFAGILFAIGTFNFLLPRALTYRKWYIEKFENFDKEKKAMIPFLI